MTQPYLDEGSLVRVLPAFGREGGSINAVFPANRHQPAALRALLDLLAEKMEQQRKASIRLKRSHADGLRQAIE